MKADPATAAIPVIMMTATSQNADVFRGWPSDVDCSLNKPFDPMELLMFVRRIFGGQTGRSRYAAGV
jgi:DNA-binding response OmpR family regulator